MSDGVIRFTLKDADGKEHKYTTIKLSPDEGEPLMWKLTGMCSESLGVLMGAMLSGKGVDDNVDLSGVGRDIANALRTEDMVGLRKAVLKHTTRGGDSLADPVNFNKAYQANYTELLHAVWEVLRVNNLFPQLGTFLI